MKVHSLKFCLQRSASRHFSAIQFPMQRPHFHRRFVFISLLSNTRGQNQDLGWSQRLCRLPQQRRLGPAQLLSVWDLHLRAAWPHVAQWSRVTTLKSFEVQESGANAFKHAFVPLPPATLVPDSETWGGWWRGGRRSDVLPVKAIKNVKIHILFLSCSSSEDPRPPLSPFSSGLYLKLFAQ